MVKEIGPQKYIFIYIYIFNLDEDDYKYLLFNDDLVTISDAGKELGEMKVTVTETRSNGVDAFLIHANSHGSIDNVPCGTSITAIVNTHLETLEQKHHEYVKVRPKGNFKIREQNLLCCS